MSVSGYFRKKDEKKNKKQYPESILVALYKVVETNKPGGGMVWNIAGQGPTLYTELAAVGVGGEGLFGLIFSLLSVFSFSCLGDSWE